MRSRMADKEIPGIKDAEGTAVRNRRSGILEAGAGDQRCLADDRKISAGRALNVCRDVLSGDKIRQMERPDLREESGRELKFW